MFGWEISFLSNRKAGIAFVVSLVSQFTHSPRKIHLRTTHKVPQHLKETPRRGILFKRNECATIEAYPDVDYARPIIDRGSTFGYCTFLGGNVVTCRSKQ